MSLSLSQLESAFSSTMVNATRHPLAAIGQAARDVLDMVKNPTQARQALGAELGFFLGGNIPTPLGISVRPQALEMAGLGLVGTAAGVGVAAGGVGLGRVGTSALAMVKRHGISALVGGSGVGVAARAGKEIYREAKRRRKAAAREKISADKAKLREQLKAAKAEAKAAKASSRRAGRRTGSKRASVLGRRPARRKMSALQLKYFGKGHK